MYDLHRVLGLLAAHGYIILFGWVAAETFGAPLPSVPILLVTGVLTATGELSFLAVWACGVLGCVAGDLFWYCLGKKWGAGVLRRIEAKCQGQSIGTMRASQLVSRYGNRAMLISKFLPGPSLVAVPLAASGRSLSAFLAYEISGSVAFVGGWLFVGRLVGDRIELLSGLTHFAATASIGLAAIVALVLVAFRFKQRRSARRTMRAPRPTPKVFDEQSETPAPEESLPLYPRVSNCPHCGLHPVRKEEFAAIAARAPIAAPESSTSAPTSTYLVSKESNSRDGTLGTCLQLILRGPITADIVTD
jgi:membrane protein DedA with SNARE-associated domain